MSYKEKIEISLNIDDTSVKNFNDQMQSFEQVVVKSADNMSDSLNSAFKKIKIPEFKVPPLKIPPIKVPPIKIPPIKFPALEVPPGGLFPKLKELDFDNLFNQKGFRNLENSFKSSFIEDKLKKVKSELIGFNQQMLKSGRITASSAEKMRLSIEKMSNDSITALQKQAKVMSGMRKLFVNLTRAFIAAQYIKEISQWADATDKLRTSVLAFKTNPQYNLIADQMERIQEVTAGAVSKLQLMPHVNKALALDVDLTNGKLLQLVEMTTKMSQAFGTDASQAFGDFTTAISKGSAIILDNIGVLLRQEEAQRLHFKTLNLSGISFNKWRAALSQAQKRAIFMEQGIKKLSEKTGELTLVQSVFRQSITELDETWKEFSLSLSDGKAFNIVVWGINKVIGALELLKLTLELTNSAFQALGITDEFKGLDSIDRLEKSVQNFNDGGFQATEIMKFFRVNLEELTKIASKSRIKFDALANTIKGQLTPAVQTQILDNAKWVKELDFLASGYLLVEGQTNKFFRTLSKGNQDMNVVARGVNNFTKIFTGLGKELGKKSLLESWVKSYQEGVKAIGDETRASESLGLIKKLNNGVTVLAGGATFLLTRSKLATAAMVSFTGVASWAAEELKQTSLNNNALTSSMKNLKTSVSEASNAMIQNAPEIRKAILDSLTPLAKNLNISSKQLQSFVKEYAKGGIAALNSGKAWGRASDFIIDKMAATNKSASKLKKKLSDMREEWIKFKISAEKSTLEGMDQKIAGITIKYVDALKKMKKLFPALKGTVFSTIFPDATRLKTDTRSFFNNFKTLKDDLDGLAIDDFTVKYKVTEAEREEILNNIKKGLIIPLENLFFAQDRFSEKLLANLNDSSVAVKKLGNDLKKLTSGITDFQLKIKNIGSADGLGFQKDLNSRKVALNKFYDNQEILIRNNFDNIRKLEDQNAIAKLESQRLVELKALKLQFQSGKQDKDFIEAKLKLNETFANKKEAITLKSQIELNRELNSIHKKRLSDLKTLTDLELQQLNIFNSEMNKQFMKTKELFIGQNSVEFEFFTGTAVNQVTDFIGFTSNNFHKLANDLRLALPEEYHTSVTIDVDSKKLKVMKEAFQNLGPEAQQQLQELLGSINPALNKIGVAMAKPGDIFRDTMLSALKDIGNAAGQFLADMTFNMSSAFNQFDADRQASLEELTEQRDKGLITQNDYLDKSANIEKKYLKDKENYEKQAQKTFLMGLGQMFWAKGTGYLVEGGIKIAGGNIAEGGAMLAGGAALIGLGQVLGHLGAGITTSNASTQAERAKEKGEKDRYIILNNELFRDQLSFKNTIESTMRF